MTVGSYLKGLISRGKARREARERAKYAGYTKKEWYEGKPKADLLEADRRREAEIKRQREERTRAQIDASWERAKVIMQVYRETPLGSPVDPEEIIKDIYKMWMDDPDATQAELDAIRLRAMEKNRLENREALKVDLEQKIREIDWKNDADPADIWQYQDSYTATFDTGHNMRTVWGEAETRLTADDREQMKKYGLSMEDLFK